jgi:hypothetical protein
MGTNILKMGTSSLKTPQPQVKRPAVSWREAAATQVLSFFFFIAVKIQLKIQDTKLKKNIIV